MVLVVNKAKRFSLFNYTTKKFLIIVNLPIIIIIIIIIIINLPIKFKRNSQQILVAERFGLAGHFLIVSPSVHKFLIVSPSVHKFLIVSPSVYKFLIVPPLVYKFL